MMLNGQYSGGEIPCTSKLVMTTIWDHVGLGIRLRWISKTMCEIVVYP